jgi:hypothetical protein
MTAMPDRVRTPAHREPPRTRSARWLLGAAVLSMLFGCSGRRVPVPAVSADAAGKEALAQYDRNKDGVLDAGELSLCPPLAQGLKALDTNKDGRLSADEIAEWVHACQDSGVGLMAVVVRVTLDGQPLAGATVTLVPEKFLGPALKTASGVSDARGRVSLETPGEKVPGVACGLYRVLVSKKNAAGAETLPARYNQATVLGLEVGPEGQKNTVHLALRGS